MFLVLAGFLAGGDPGVVTVAAPLLALAYGVSRRAHRGGLAGMLVRLRWLWLSLAVLYFWFTPGAPLWPQLGHWSPTREGVALGSVRIATLALMTAGAHLLVQTTAREQLILGLEGLLRPLRVFGFDRERFALRLLLVLETVPRLATSSGPQPRGRRDVSGLVQRLERRLLESLARAEREPDAPLVIPMATAPPWPQWLWPVAFAATLGAAGALL